MTYEQIEQAWLSGQITEAEMQSRMKDDPAFASWMAERVKARAS